MRTNYPKIQKTIQIIQIRKKIRKELLIENPCFRVHRNGTRKHGLKNFILTIIGFNSF